MDIHKREIYPAIVSLSDGKITGIEKTASAPDVFIMPGLVDAHIHIESSMITPGAFASIAVTHGTTSVVSDPHEIANVLGEEGVMYMIEDAKKVPLKFYFGAPSCVPTTVYETNGAILNHEEIRRLLELPQIHYLSEMMNYPGVINDDDEVLKKIQIAKELGKPIDGHAPGLKGEMLRKYIAAGITTDHECSTLAEAREKIESGMKVLIREGSAARNLNALKDLFRAHPQKVMLCTDDMHPETLKIRHINKLISTLISEGYDMFDVIRSATINPYRHYNLEPGLLRLGDQADFILVDSPDKMNVLETWIDGKRVFGDGKVEFDYKPGKALNRFNCHPVKEEAIKVKAKTGIIRVIEAFEGELLTKEVHMQVEPKKYFEADTKNDILKIVVKDRYNDSPPAIGFIKGFGLKKGAFASSVAHDSHNIIAVGTNDADIISVINEIVRLKGGLAATSNGEINSLQLNIAGIMTTRSCNDVAIDYENLNKQVKTYGCSMKSPFMTLSFMALLVIPDLKISDMGLFDVNRFQLVSLFV